jgi:isoleucyl-tRNA synthetase
MKHYGADFLRLWIASADYRNEMALSDEILKRVADAYRRIRNTARFLLGNLHGFDPTKDLVAADKSLLLDQWAIQQAYDTQQAVLAAYSKYDFPEIVQRIQNFCTNELGSLYLDITKDRLYTMQENSHGRRSAQSAMYRILEALVRWLAPILSFTAEEIWQAIPGQRSESVMFATWYDGLDPVQGSPEQREAWSELLKIRAAVSKQLETMRAAGEIGASLEADVRLYADFLPFAAILSGDEKQAMDELRFFFITSGLKVAPPSEKPDDAIEQKTERLSYWIAAKRSADQKCIRCWHLRPDVGIDPNNPEICGRCVSNLPGHPGEARLFF